MEYFEKWMDAIGLSPGRDLCLQNLTRCRPPGSRPPFPEEIKRCGTVLAHQLAIHRPRVILALGPVCGTWFARRKGVPLEELRSQIYNWEGIPVVISYSPHQVLTHDELKRPVWEDLKTLRNILNGS